MEQSLVAALKPVFDGTEPVAGVDRSTQSSLAGAA